MGERIYNIRKQGRYCFGIGSIQFTAEVRMNVGVGLPDFINPSVTCCFTGHRHINEALRGNVIRATDKAILQLYRKGYRYFIAGGALGYDMLAEIEVIRSARYDDEIKLILALPCHDQTSKWTHLPDYIESLRKYRKLLGLAYHTVYVNDFYTPTCMKERNLFMVEHSSACIAYYNGALRSGTGQTVRMAQKAGINVINIYDEVYGHN